MKQVRSIHFVGIKGVGMTPLALIAKEAGCRVTGSDVADEFITDSALADAGIKPLVGFHKLHIGKVDLVITTGAHGGFENPEVLEAKAQKIPVMTKGEAVGVFMEGSIFGKKYVGISISGTHGKTTTTAMVATILKETSNDPSYVIGTGEIPSLKFPGHFGKGRYFVAEADEYATEPKHDLTPQFIWQHPKIVVITNIDYDHPDLYPSLGSVTDAFVRFVGQIPKDGTLIAFGENREVQKLLETYSGYKVTYGFHAQNTYQIKRVTFSGKRTFFWLETNGTDLGEFMLQLSGEHNVLNATAAIIVSLEAGVPIESIRKALRVFVGSRRRMEYVGDLVSGALVYDDYAHHPTEIQATLRAIRVQYPKKKIVCIFQPHTFSRTKSLFEEFSYSFSLADAVVLTEIYASLRELPDASVSSGLLVKKIQTHHKNAIYAKSLSDVVEYIDQNSFKSDTVLVVMGAGDIYKIIDDLALKKH